MSMTTSLSIPNLPGMTPNKSSWVYRERDGFKKSSSGPGVRPQSASVGNRSSVFNQTNQIFPPNQSPEISMPPRPSTAQAGFVSMSLGQSGLGRSSSQPLLGSRPSTAIPTKQYNLNPLMSSGHAYHLHPSPEAIAYSQSEPKIPRFVQTDKLICRIYGHFFSVRPWDREGALGHTQIESVACRKVTILYYIFDDTIEISESRVANSGMPQGIFFKRGRPNLDDKKRPVKLEDLAPGGKLRILGQIFHLTDADAFTRDYFKNELNIVLPPSLNQKQTADRIKPDMGASLATGLGASLTAEKSSFNTTSTTYLAAKENLDATNRFLKYNGQVLRFLCVEVNSPFAPYFPELEMYLEDRGVSIENASNGHGFVASDVAKKYALSFYLDSNKVDVVLQRPAEGQREAGVDEPKLVLKKGKLAKNWRDVRNNNADPKYYEASDFRCGQVVDTYGRYFLIVGCDTYTQEAFERMGILQRNVPLLREDPYKIVQPIPELGDGFLPIGSNEDTLATVYGMPKVSRDVAKIYKNQGRQLRCKAILLTENIVDKSREFFLTFFLEDDTVQVFEDVKRNSGIWGGTFLKRGRYMNELPNECDEPRYFLPTDIYLGNVVSLNGNQFQIIEMDNLSLKFCESYPDEFPMSDTFKIVGNMMLQVISQQVDIRPAFKAKDKQKKGFLDQDAFIAVLDYCNLAETLQDQELLTLLRRFKENDNYYYQEMCDLVSHLYFHHSGKIAPKDATNNQNFLVVARSKTIQWRRMFRKDKHTLRGNVTLALLQKLFGKHGLPMSDNVAFAVAESYRQPNSVAGPILDELFARRRDHELYDGLDTKVRPRTAQKSKVRENLLQATAVSRKLAEIRKTVRHGGTGVSLLRSNKNTGLEQPQEEIWDPTRILIDYNRLCDDIYQCEWTN